MRTRLLQAERLIKAGDLWLEPILPGHAAKLFEALQAPELYTFVPQDPPVSVEALEQRYRRLSKRQSPKGDELWLNYAVYDCGESVYVGTAQATLQKSGKALIAYEVFPQFWRRHIASRACSALIDHLFADYGVSAISALTDTRNTSSQKLLESLAFRRTGMIENADEFKGSVSDEYSFELERGEWAARPRSGQPTT